MDKEHEETFEAPQIPYDKRSGPFTEVGREYGVGKRNPVGSFKASNVSPIPMKSFKKDVYQKAQKEPKDD